MPIGYDVEIISVGEMYIIAEDAYSIDITATDTFECLAGFNKGKETDISIDEIAGQITINRAGSYKFNGIASLEPSVGMTLDFAVFVNGVKAVNISSVLEFQNSQDRNTFSGTGWLDLNVGDVVSVKGKADALGTIYISNMNINLGRHGR